TEQAPTILTMKSARCSRQRRTITIGPSARPQLRTGQWKCCALLHARYTLDRT
ncbi:hypothetical protein HN011_000624, partial [Eciton burchellii]